jgi:pimeloyl-ACP methyl ester carboxylesterase
MRSVLAIDPGRELHELTTPALIVSGGHDLQATPEDAAALAAARPDAARLDLPEMNHDLKIAPADAAGQQAIHSDPGRPLAPGLGRAIAKFVQSVSR